MLNPTEPDLIRRLINPIHSNIARHQRRRSAVTYLRRRLRRCRSQLNSSAKDGVGTELDNDQELLALTISVDPSKPAEEFAHFGDTMFEIHRLVHGKWCPDPSLHSVADIDYSGWVVGNHIVRTSCASNVAISHQRACGCRGFHLTVEPSQSNLPVGPLEHSRIPAIGPADGFPV